MSMLPDRPAGTAAIDYYVYQDRPQGRELIFGSGQGGQFRQIPYEAVTGGDYVELPINFAGNQWTVVALPAGGMINVYGQWEPWLAAFISLIIALVFAWAAVALLGGEQVIGTRSAKGGRRQDADNEGLIKSEEKLRSILGNVVDGIVTITPRGEIDSANAAALQMFGYEEDELLGQNIGILMMEPFRSNHDAYIKAYIDTGEAKILGKKRDLTGQKKDGTTVPIELAVSEIKEGDTHLFTGVMRDITDRKRVDHLKNEFISTVSHELRTPLTSIRGSLGIVVNGLAGQLPDKASTLLKIAHQKS